MLLGGIGDIRREKFDIAVDLSMVSQYSFLLWLIGVKVRFGFDYKNRGFFLNNKISIEEIGDRHILSYYIDLLKLMGVREVERELKFYTSLADRQYADRFLSKNNISEKDILIGVAPFGGGSWGKDAIAKQWPDEKYANLMRQLLKAKKYKLLLFGTKKNIDDCAVFKDLLSNKNVVSAIGQTSLGQLAALIGKCSLFISNDSGPMHIACAKGVDTISIFGPVDEQVYGPVGYNADHEIVKADVDCRPCYKNFKKPDCATVKCLNQISETQVMETVNKLLKKKSERN
jgi:heptosyltransferase-2